LPDLATMWQSDDLYAFVAISNPCLFSFFQLVPRIEEIPKAGGRGEGRGRGGEARHRPGVFRRNGKGFSE
jgi:hypothetical protein